MSLWQKEPFGGGEGGLPMDVPRPGKPPGMTAHYWISTVKGVRTEDDAHRQCRKAHELEEKGPAGFRPVNDQENQLDDGNEEAGQAPPNALPEGGDQKEEPANEEDDDSQCDEQNTGVFHVSQIGDLGRGRQGGNLKQT